METFRLTALFFILALLVGCSSPIPTGHPPGKFRPLSGWMPGTQADTPPAPALTPVQSAANSFTRYGVLLTVAGAVIAALTRFSSGWGLSLIAAGISMVLLAWVFRQWWIPWTALLTVISYTGYKLWNRLNPSVETEPVLR